MPTLICSVQERELSPLPFPESPLHKVVWALIKRIHDFIAKTQQSVNQSVTQHTVWQVTAKMMAV